MTTAAASTAVPPRVDVEDVLARGGLSKFHKRAVIVTGIAWTFVAMEILLIGFVQPIFAGLWNLNGTWQGLVNSAALAGSLVGSLVLGRLSDKIGRRVIFQYAILWYAAFTALTALAWGPWSVMTLRFLAGLGLGGMLVVDPSILAEYLPPQRRGRLLAFLDFWWPVGLLMAIGLSYIFLGPNFDRFGDNSWRYLFLAAAFPAFLAFFIRRNAAGEPVLPRSQWTLEGGGRGAARDHGVAGRGGRDHDRTGARGVRSGARRQRAAQPDDRRRADLDRAQRVLLRPVPLAAVRAPGREELPRRRLPAADAERARAVPRLRRGDLARRADRAQADAGRLPDLGGISAYAFAVADTSTVYVTALFFVGFFNLGAWGAVYPYTAENFPTRLRSSAFGVMEGVGKAAAIAGPYIFGHLKDVTGGTTWSLTFIAIVMAAGGVVAAFFGRETRGEHLT